MVAKIKPGTSLRQSFYYNENKVKEGVATALHAENYPWEASQISEANRLRMLEKMAALNPRLSVNSVHISLNFDPSETIPQDRMVEIARSYMDKLGFGGQPYLVYEHRDAAHPHLHILTTNIQMDGTKIDLHHLAIRKSEPARKELELEYGLVQAESKTNTYKLEPAHIQKISYGKRESKKALAVVLEAICRDYKFTSLPELNAILKQYNVLADPGQEGSRIRLNKGLLYRILDEDGKPIGVPVKASLFHFSPTLKHLEQQFIQHEKARQPYKEKLKSAIDLYFLRNRKISMQGLTDTLKKTGITVVQRQNEQGTAYGITYIDYRTKCVFNGSALGKAYSAKAIMERCGTANVQIDSAVRNNQINTPAPGSQSVERPSQGSTNETGNLLTSLLQPEYVNDYLPLELRGRKKKKKKKKRY